MLVSFEPPRTPPACPHCDEEMEFAICPESFGGPYCIWVHYCDDGTTPLFIDEQMRDRVGM